MNGRPRYNQFDEDKLFNFKWYTCVEILIFFLSVLRLNLNYRFKFSLALFDGKLKGFLLCFSTAYPRNCTDCAATEAEFPFVRTSYLAM